MKFILFGIVGFLLGVFFSLFIQVQYEVPIGTWLIVIGIILTLFVLIGIFIPVMIIYVSALVGFFIGIIFGVYIWTIFPGIVDILLMFKVF
jgi:hypothetical protein